MKLSQRSRASLSWPQPGLHSGVTTRGKFTKAPDPGLTWILLHLWPFPIARNFKNVQRPNIYFKHGLLLPEIMHNMCIVIMFPGSCIVGKVIQTNLNKAVIIFCTHSVHLPISAGGGGLNLSRNFQKRGTWQDLFLEGSCWERRGWLFLGGVAIIRQKIN